MTERRRGSIRLWQTQLFIAVIAVAILILSGSLSAGLNTTLARMAETSELRNAAALAQRLTPEFPLGTRGTSAIKDTVAEYRDIYGGGIWVYSAEGDLIEAAFDSAPVDAVLESARLGALGERGSDVSSDLRPNGWIVASKALHGASGTLEGVVITASSADPSVTILRAVRDRLWVTFWVSLVVAGLIGFGFAELISRRMRAMSAAAAAMAAGDFEQRLSEGLMPDEMQQLVHSYNTMAATLGDAFEAIQDSRRQIATVVESMAEGVLAIDGSGAARVVNPEALRLLGLQADSVIGVPVDALIRDEDLLGIVSEGLAGVSGTHTLSIGAHIVQVHSTPMRGAGGEVDGTVLLLADVTERQRMEDAQRRFVADASHEMRTPIAAIKGMLELLADGAKDVPRVRDDFIATMQAESDRLSRLVADLLTLAQLEAGSLRLQRAPEYVSDLLNDVARVMSTLSEPQGVTIAVEVDDEGARVDVDRDRIIQVLLSFTDNALKHSPQGSTIHLRAHGEDDTMTLEVADEGTGIPAEELSRVFERFYRADTARVAGSGTGLGLAIARELVEAHGARIEVRSDPGSGTVFGFALPVV